MVVTTWEGLPPRGPALPAHFTPCPRPTSARPPCPCAGFAPWKVLAQRAQGFGEELPGFSRWQRTAGCTRASCYDEMRQTPRRVSKGLRFDVRPRFPDDGSLRAPRSQGLAASRLMLRSQCSARSFPRGALCVCQAAEVPRQGLPGGRAGAYLLEHSLLLRPARTAPSSLGLR